MVLSGDQDEPFWYARVIGVFHARVMVTHERVAHKGWEWMPFLFFRWFGAEPGYTPGFDGARLPKIGFVQWEADRDNYPFGFLDPAEILQGCHLIPAFHLGHTTELLPHDCAVARQVKVEHQDPATGATEDWTNYYVNVFVDRDMVMRHFGGGIGHRSKLKPTNPGAEPSNASDDEDDAGHDNSVPLEFELEEIERRLEELDQRGDEGIDNDEHWEEPGADMEEEESEKEELQWYNEELGDPLKREKAKPPGEKDDTRIKRIQDEIKTSSATRVKGEKGTLIVEFSIENIQVVQRRSNLQKEKKGCDGGAASKEQELPPISPQKGFKKDSARQKHLKHDHGKGDDDEAGSKAGFLPNKRRKVEMKGDSEAVDSPSKTQKPFSPVGAPIGRKRKEKKSGR
ncbi:hypothetical protein EST38_g11212, partial [Candolleomyces aberdarensis]